MCELRLGDIDLGAATLNVRLGKGMATRTIEPEGSDASFISTFPGVGYRLEPPAASVTLTVASATSTAIRCSAPAPAPPLSQILIEGDRALGVRAVDGRVVRERDGGGRSHRC